MCQKCVTDGEMTQAELDRAVLAGDTSVMPINALPIEQYAAEIAKAVTIAVLTGEMDSEDAKEFLLAAAAAYRDPAILDRP